MPKAKRTRTGLLALSALTMLAVSISPATAAPSETPTLSGPDVYLYEQPEVLANATRFILQGSRLASGGCSFTVDAVRKPGVAPTREIELAYDESSCQSLRERGTPTVPATSASGGTGQPSGEAAPGTVDGVAPASLGQFRAYLHSWFRDPPGFHVNDVTNTVIWSPDGSCANAGGAATPNPEYDWLQQTGWRPLSTNWNRGQDCNGVFSSSYAHFDNRFFCAAITGNSLMYFWPTETEYDRNNITGLPDGSYRITITWRKSGGCHPLLAFDYDSP